MIAILPPQMLQEQEHCFSKEEPSFFCTLRDSTFTTGELFLSINCNSIGTLLTSIPLRHVISGAAGVVFYGLPLFSHYYPEILSFPPSNPFTASGEVIAETAFTAFSLFTVFDKLALERIVGQKKASVLLSSDKSVHMFY